MNKTGIVIVAAGSSSRLGSAKQMLLFRDKTLLQHVISEAETAGAQAIVVVTGARAGDISASIRQHNVDIVFNENWEQGMASGIVAGVLEMIALHSEIERIILAVCDQPFVTADLFSRLCQQQNESEKPVVASAYAGTFGTPVLFTRAYFDKLLELKGDQGAKKLLKAHPEDVATVDFPEGRMDIDTQEDYERFLKNLDG
jgi:molybdenum cofactor cytidylyltransferase